MNPNDEGAQAAADLACLFVCASAHPNPASMPRNHKHTRGESVPGGGGSAAASSSDSREAREAAATHARALEAALNPPSSSSSGGNSGPDLAALRSLSVGGFGHDGNRRRIWPLLLGVDTDELDRQAAAAAAAAASVAASSTAATPAASTAAQHLRAPRDYFSGVLSSRHALFSQIEKDLARSMAHLDVVKRAFKERKRSEARLALGRILHTLFSLHEGDLHYVQGFHDIAQVFLLVCAQPSDPSAPFSWASNARGEELAFHLTERLALLHLRDSLRPTLDAVVQTMSLIFPLLARADPPVHALLQRAHVQSFFSLSWILTWFSHNLDRLGDVARVFDFFLSSHPLMPVYATVALITQLREGLMQLQEQAVQEARNRWNEERRAELDAQAAQNAFAAAAAVSETGHSIPAATGAAAPSSSAADEDASFDPSSVTVEMSAVHLYFQNLPPLLDLDALFRRCQHLSADTPPAALIALVPELARAIPPDSPLLLLDGKGLDELPTKLTNYLDWKRMQKRNDTTAQQKQQLRQQEQPQQHSGATRGESSSNGHAAASSSRDHANNVPSSTEGEDDVDDSRKYVSVAAPLVSSTAAASSAVATAAAAATASSSKKSAKPVILTTRHTFRSRVGVKAAAAAAGSSSSSSSSNSAARGATGVVGALVSSCASLGSSGPVSVFAYPSVRAPLAHLVRFVLHARAKQLARNILAKGRAVSTKLRSRMRVGGGGPALRNNQLRGFAASSTKSSGVGGHSHPRGRMPRAATMLLLLLVALALLVAVVAILLGAYRVEIIERLPELLVRLPPSVSRWLNAFVQPATTNSD
jgi:hypothetical protein